MPTRKPAPVVAPLAPAEDRQPLVISYRRWSSGAQGEGDSERRQTEAARKWCEARGLTLDTQYVDEGRSAYHGRNTAAGGKLYTLLQAVKDGTIPPGSTVLVESLDRVSRMDPRKALRALEDLVDAGLRVVTLTDKQEYTAESLSRDPGALLFSVVSFIRANQESEHKASRSRANWEAKRKSALTTPMTARLPGWLRLNPETGKVEPIPERAEVVRRVFTDTLAGKGQHAIAQALNREGVTPFGKAAFWSRSYIAKLLASPAAKGTFQPHVMEHANGKRLRKPLEETIEGYFPAVVSPKVWARAQALRTTENSGRAPARTSGQLQNLFAGLAKCGMCGRTATVVYKGALSPRRYFACTGARAGTGCKFGTVDLRSFELGFLLHADSILGAPQGNTRVARQLAEAEAAEQAAADLLERVIDELLRSPSPALRARRTRLEGEREQLTAQVAALRAEAEASSLALVRARVKELRKALHADPMDRHHVNALLRLVFTAVHLDKTNGRAVFVWRGQQKTDAPLADRQKQADTKPGPTDEDTTSGFIFAMPPEDRD